MKIKNKNRGGVALFVDKKLKYKVVEKRKNVIVSCIYRTPDSNSEIFKEWVDKAITQSDQDQVVFICGNFNIDSLNPNKYNMTKNTVE